MDSLAKLDFMKSKDHLLWLDLEMTGLDPETDTILEIATLITDSKLKEVAEGPVIAIHHPDSVLEAMNEWCQKTHGKSGLTERVKTSSVSMAEAEQQTLEFAARYLDPQVSPLCGNSIWQDRRFLARYMPKLESFCHYRIIDVSTLKELARRWRPELLAKVKKADRHEALADIRESVAELQLYREQFIQLR